MIQFLQFCIALEHSEGRFCSNLLNAILIIVCNCNKIYIMHINVINFYILVIIFKVILKSKFLSEVITLKLMDYYNNSDC